MPPTSVHLVFLYSAAYYFAASSLLAPRETASDVGVVLDPPPSTSGTVTSSARSGFSTACTKLPPASSDAKQLPLTITYCLTTDAPRPITSPHLPPELRKWMALEPA
eukprot:CAMPEP_0184547146 /NCGR_PEP_ID=MMETSP0199_2-20130426/5390_1 /TAXON_ID=1112570 /ORGANISM="Thraustochytrium sp., Strain LLF1b" /LENGTH=106 /DNA_ID=CAMNT_0026941609 /DNA_START=896 /DNA_END=1212 /DNA_ORIENTATION=+